MGICDTCAFWQVKSRYHGLCRRYPPTMIMAGKMPSFSYEPIHPSTKPHDFCGEYKEKVDI